MIRVAILTLLAVVTLFAYSVQLPARVTTAQVLWARDWIESHVRTSGAFVVPSVSLDLESHTGDIYYGLTLWPEDGWYPDIQRSPTGTVLFETGFDMGSPLWQGVLIHEVCHHIDNIARRGHLRRDDCGCDPFDLQYMYYKEIGHPELDELWRDDRGKLLHHDAHRECRLR